MRSLHRRNPRRLGLCLLKDTYNLRLKFRKFQSQYNAARMENQIAALGQQPHVAA
jgi:hypothetical protein